MERSPFDAWMDGYSFSKSSSNNNPSHMGETGVGSYCMLPDGSEGVIDFDGNCVPVEGDFGFEEPQVQVPAVGAYPVAEPESPGWLSRLFGGAPRGTGGMYGGGGYLPPADTSVSDHISQASSNYFDTLRGGDWEEEANMSWAQRFGRALGGEQPSRAPQQPSQAFGMPDHYSKWLPEEKEPTSFLESLKGLEGEEGSPQRRYHDYIAGGGEMTPEKIAEAEAYAESMGTTFDPATGYSRKAYEDYEADQASLRSPNELVGFDPAYEGQSLSDWMSYRDEPWQRSKQVLDPQGRFRRESDVYGATPQERSAITDHLFPGQAAYDSGSFDMQSPIAQGIDEGVPSLGHYRNVARAQGAKGSSQIAFAKQLRNAEIERRKELKLERGRAETASQTALIRAKTEAGELQHKRDKEAEAKARRDRKVMNKTQSMMIQHKNLISKAQEAGKNIGFGTTGKAGALLKFVPSSGAYDQQTIIDTLNADLAFSALSEIRDNSPTGGALGNVSDKDLDLLKSMKQTLKVGMSHELFAKNLSDYIDARNETVLNLYDDMIEDYGPEFANKAFGVSSRSDLLPNGEESAQAGGSGVQDEDTPSSADDLMSIYSLY